MANQQRTDAGLRELALFAGAGGGILGGHLLGWRTVCAVEWEPYAASVLAARQNDGLLPPFPIWDDVQTFDGRPWRGRVDVVSGGFPCQDISVAGRGAGIDGERSGMWKHMARIVCEVQPRYVFVENSPILTSRGLGRVLGDLAEMGFDAEWGCISAAETGAPHKRDRMWIVADSTNKICHERRGFISVGENLQGLGRVQPDGLSGICQEKSDVLANANGIRQSRSLGFTKEQQSSAGREAWGESYSCGDVANPNRHTTQGLESESQQGRVRRPSGLLGRAGVFQPWPADPANEAESSVGRVAHGVAARVDRLKAIGNGQVSRVAATAWQILSAPFLAE